MPGISEKSVVKWKQRNVVKNIRNAYQSELNEYETMVGDEFVVFCTAAEQTGMFKAASKSGSKIH